MPARSDPGPGLRVLFPDDLGQVELILDGWKAFSPQEIALALEVCNEAAAHPLQEFHGYGIKEGSRLYGFVVFGEIPLADRGWDLYWLGVERGYAQQGLGRRLLKAMEGMIRDQGGRQIHIETASSPALAPARGLYQATGFILAARLPHYFREGVDKLLYLKNLPGRGSPNLTTRQHG